MSLSPRIVVAPDSFKGSLDADAVAAAMAAGVLAAAPDATVVRRPMADGGEGTASVLAAVWGVPLFTADVVDARGRASTGRFSVSPDGRLGVVELAEASGLPAVADLEPAPLDAHTVGVGQLAAAVLDAGVDEVLVCLGGSASTDGGTGFLTGLGARLLDGQGAVVSLGGRGLLDVVCLDLSRLHPRARQVRWFAAVDVDNPLTGPLGAAAVFGPQKGATPDDVAVLDLSLARWAQVLREATGRDVTGVPGMGAAGGMPSALVAVLDAQVRGGAAFVAETIGLPDAIAGADLVLTGEGSFDCQSLHGKVVGEVARIAGAAPNSPPVVVIAGRVGLEAGDARRAGVTAAFSVAPGPSSLDELQANAAALVTESAHHIGALRFAHRDGFEGLTHCCLP